MTDYLTIRDTGAHEIDIKKSQFICDLARINDEAAAQQFIAYITQQRSKATHHTFAYVLGPTDPIQRASDGGEPSGTAGVPILEVLRRTGLHNVIAVVTRYFGGIKLGASGLIRAYSNATSTAIEHIGIVRIVTQQQLQITLGYHQYDAFVHFLTTQGISIIDTRYTDQVTVTVAVDLDAVTSTLGTITDHLQNQLQVTLGAQVPSEVPVTPKHPNQDGQQKA